MAYVIPAIRGKMGSTTFYEGTMLAQQLVGAVRPAIESDDWATWGIEERMQRVLDLKRIRDEIVPYLQKSPDRFFGSIIVLVYKPNVFTWEPVGSLGKLPAAYTSVAQNMGFLTIDGGELIVLDGQHRVVALREIVNSKRNKNSVLAGDVPNDEVCVIFIDHENNEKTRRIFNKVNRYAKPTGRADNIITSEDDGYAIVTRRLMRKTAPFGFEYQSETGERELIIDWKNNTITGKSQKFSTVSVLYETAKVILAYEKIKDFDEKSRVHRPSDEELDKAYELVASFWEDVIETMDAYQVVFQEFKRSISTCVDKRKDESPYSLLFKPAGQIAFINGLIIAVERGQSLQEGLARANHIDWSTSSPVWRGTIVGVAGRMNTSKQAYEMAAELIAYLVADEFMEDADRERLKRLYNEARGFDYANIGDDAMPEELPEPASAVA